MASRVTIDFVPAYSMSKYAANSFSDALRRETRKFGIKVSTIDPLAYNTQMSTEQYVTQHLDKVWEESTDQVRRLYGEDYLRGVKELSAPRAGILVPGQNIYEVVDLVVEAVRSPDPEARYTAIPGGYLMKILVDIIFNKMPTDLLDFILYKFEQIRMPELAYFRKGGSQKDIRRTNLCHHA